MGSVPAGCRTSLPPPDAAPVVWRDDDRHPFSPPPESFYSPFLWDGADNAFFRPLAEYWRFEAPREAANVNAVDEVPDSSWFTNRIGPQPLSPEVVARGACTPRSRPVPPWTVTSGKPDGANPGFFITDARGQRYLLKTDGLLQPERPSAADTIGAAIYHAAGYFAPCNQVVFFDRDIITLAPDAEAKFTRGVTEKMTQDHVERVLSKAARAPDGRWRASVSRFIEARPISPWRYAGVRADDANDVIPHQHRRELRGMYVLAAWIDHIDSRQENTLAAWVETHGGGYVRHYVIDFGDSFGQLAPWDPLSKRLGHSGYVDFPHIFVDFITLGLMDRPWFGAELGAAGPTLGYYDVRRFDPDAWHPGYPNPAFDRRTERDAAWMARIIARFGAPHVEALVERARFSDPVDRAELRRILLGRRRAILDRYLTRLSPLAHPRLAGDTLCLEDLAVSSGLRVPGVRSHRAWISDRAGRDRASVPVDPRDQGRSVCVSSSRIEAGDARVELWSASVGLERTGPLTVEVARVERAPAVVALRRAEPGGTPR